MQAATNVATKNNFQEKGLSHKFSTWVFVRHFVSGAFTVYQEPHFWRTDGQELFALISQFLEFMGGSNLTHAHSNYLICICLYKYGTRRYM